MKHQGRLITQSLMRSCHSSITRYIQLFLCGYGLEMADLFANLRAAAAR
jgi:hypothetical protein